ncbi:MAG: GDP-mannose 4,6-dehydratase [Chitinophagales bacterium]|nr:GDP-mannose 4,6-dehydratase [Chitinophagales bacterium]
MAASECVMITGSAGMVGASLIDFYCHLLPKEKIIGTWFKPTIDLADITGKCEAIECDVTNANAVFSVINQYRPSRIYHLAAQSYPTVSWQKPVETINTNMNGTINVFESVKKIRESESDYDPMIVVACSSAEYGLSLTPENTPVKEEVPLLPLHPYGVSKVGQDLLSFQYFQNFQIRCIRVRIFNTTGIRKTKDVTSDFVLRAFQVMNGAENIFRVGNLETKRAITDVRDLVSALVLLGDKGTAGEVYNVSGEKVYQVKELIPIIEKEIGMDLNIVADPELFRPSDEPIIFGDSSKLKMDTGWRQQFPLDETIGEMLRYLKQKASTNVPL